METERFQVLLVDDDASLLTSMELILSHQFDVRSCTTPYEALRVVQRDPFHVVCADYQMPGMDGLQFFRMLWNLALPVRPCCVLITAHALDILDKVSPEDRRILGILRKPFKPDALIERVSLFAGVADLRRSSAKLKAAVKAV
jgi:CheY-like chemotaxis protein